MYADRTPLMRIQKANHCPRRGGFIKGAEK
jgi:hypothetical protein